jgi:hypothetical protein
VEQQKCFEKDTSIKRKQVLDRKKGLQKIKEKKN